MKMNKLLTIYANMTKEERETAQTYLDLGYALTEIEALEFAISQSLGRLNALKKMCYDYRNERKW